jgi:uncharacterized protein YcbK (DUF882 family)
MCLPFAAMPATAIAVAAPRRLTFAHTHTGEKLDVVYYENGAYMQDALEEINYILRDFRSNEVFGMDVALLDFLHTTQRLVVSHGQFEIISAYRSPATNEMLRTRGGGVARNSQHLRGKAIDVRLTDVATADLRQAALGLARGGVGYYPKSDFVHLDTGRVRWW